MDWENERWVKLYTRETGELVAMGWEARAFLRELLCRCDRSGVVAAETDDELAALVRMPSHVVTACHMVLRERGILSRTDHGVLINNFMEAQEARTSDRERQRRSRERRRENSSLQQETVTACHTVSQDVTTRVEESRVEETSIARKRAHQLPDDWEPNENHIARAEQLRLKVSAQVEAFRDHHLAKGSVMKDWDRAFNTWLRNAPRFQGGAQGSSDGKIPPKLERLGK